MPKIKCRNNFGKIVEISREKFIFRPSAYGLIVQRGKIVTLRNKSNGKIWFPGGGIEVGERITRGLRREIKEETGLDVRIGNLMLARENFFYYQPLDEAYHAFLFFYYCQRRSGRLKTDDQVDDLESKKPRWTDLQKIKKTDIGDLAEDIFVILTRLRKQGSV